MERLDAVEREDDDDAVCILDRVLEEDLVPLLSGSVDDLAGGFSAVDGDVEGVAVLDGEVQGARKNGSEAQLGCCQGGICQWCAPVVGVHIFAGRENIDTYL